IPQRLDVGRKELPEGALAGLDLGAPPLASLVRLDVRGCPLKRARRLEGFAHLGERYAGFPLRIEPAQGKHPVVSVDAIPVEKLLGAAGQHAHGKPAFPLRRELGALVGPRSGLQAAKKLIRKNRAVGLSHCPRSTSCSVPESRGTFIPPIIS